LIVEEAGASLEDSMRLAEDMMVATVSRVLDRCRPLLDALDRDLSVPKAPFQRMTYDDALREAGKRDLRFGYGEELPQVLEAQMSREAGGFLWITDYPKSCRGFYYRESDDGEHVRSMDLLYPEGFGEAISGGRESTGPT
jgi:asparaginyl-tRNA synthetase